jgi:hypothetical protein
MDKIVKEAMERYEYANTAESVQRQEMLDDIRFRALDQWPDEVRNARENDPNGARPCLTLDRTNQYIRQVVNDARQNKPSIKTWPVDSGSDVEVAEIYNGIIRHIENNSNAEVAYDTALDSACTNGLGYFRILTKEVRNGLQDIFIAPIRNPLAVYFDCDSIEVDGSDGMWCLLMDDVPTKRFKTAYPKASEINFADDHNNWIDKEVVKVAEYFKVDTVEKNQIILQDGTRLSEVEYWELVRAIGFKPPIHDNEMVKERVVEWWKLNGKEPIEDKIIFPCSYIPIIPVHGNEYWIENKRVLTGMIRGAKDAQRLYNYSYSSMIERVALEPKAPYIAAAGQVEQFADMWKTANTTNRAVLVYDPIENGGSAVPPPQRQQMDGSFSSWIPILQTCDTNIQASLGMYQASLGMQSNETSGKAIMARQREGDNATFHYIDNLSRSMRHAGRILVEMIPKIYDTTRVARIIGEDETDQMVKIDPSQGEAVREVKKPNGKIEKIYNLGIGEYDVTVSVGPSYTTKRQEAADGMIQLAQANPNLFGMIGDVIVKNLDWPGADEIAKRLKKMLPPNLQDAPEGTPELPEEAQMMVDQMSQGLEQAQQGLQEAGMTIQELEAKIAELEAEKKDKEAQNEISAYDAETKRIAALAKVMSPEEIQQIVLSTIASLMTSPDISEGEVEEVGEVEESMEPQFGSLQDEDLPPEDMQFIQETILATQEQPSI